MHINIWPNEISEKKKFKIFKMRFFAIFLLVAMAMAQESDETTTAATTTVIATETTTFAETTEVLGTGTVVSFWL